MFLAIDIGNTETSFGLLTQGKVVHHWRAKTESLATKDAIASFLFPLAQLNNLNRELIKGVGICSVVPKLNGVFTDFVQKYLTATSFMVDCEMTLPFEIRVDRPEEVGADRLANAAFAVRFLRLPAVVIDMGTAITFDVISSQKTYEGGMILPGVGLAADSLGLKTARLPRIELQTQKALIGKNTADCISSGIWNGYSELLRGLLARFKAELGAELNIVCTGGWGKSFCEAGIIEAEYFPNLTLEGIYSLAPTQLR